MRFGIAQQEITPPFPTSMAGYGARRDHFDRVNDPLTFTAIIIEEGEHRALLGAADLCQFADHECTRRLIEDLAKSIGCPEDNIMLNASHTHGGPKLPSYTAYYRRRYDTGAAERYAEWLAGKVLATVRKATESLEDGTLWYGEGRTTLPINRRLYRDGRMTMAPNPAGPVDDRLQLLLLRDASGALKAVGMKVSCHPVATGAQHLLTADYPGAWRAEFQRAFGKKVTPFFLQGAGADARPRHTAQGDGWLQLKHEELSLVGQELLAECLQVLTGTGLKPLENLVLVGKTNTVSAPCEQRYTRKDELEQLLERGGYEREYAEEAIALLEAGKPIPDHVEFQVQTLWLNAELALIGLNAEPLCALGRYVESSVAPAHAILLGYTNGCICYAPDSQEMQRGGYETESYLFSCWSGPLMPGLEKLLAAGVERLQAQETIRLQRRLPW